MQFIGWRAEVEMKYKFRILINIVIIIIIFCISNWIILKTDVKKVALLEPVNLFTYLGVLTGFSITIYTFGLTMIENINTNIDKLPKLSEDKKKEYKNSLINGFKEIREDIWCIFTSIIIVILFSILKSIKNPFEWDVEKFKIPETINLAIFIYSSLCIYDILKTLFNLSEINFILLDQNNQQ